MLLLLLAAFTCPPDQRLEVDLAAWKTGLLAAEPGSDDELAGLRALRFQMVVPEGCGKPAGIDIFDAPLTEAGGKVAQVRYQCGWGQALRIAVLVPLSKAELCKLDGEDLSIDQDKADTPCENAAKLPRTLGFVELIARGRKVIQTRDQSGSCEKDGSTSSTRTAFYEAQGWSLKKIFETQTWDSTTAAQGRQLVQRWKLSLGKAFPKEIGVRHCVEGGSCDDPEVFHYAKAGGKYVGK